MTNATVTCGDCAVVLKALPAGSFDSCVTDPPYGLSFMGHKWDYDVPSAAVWREVYRVLKPGAHLLATFSARTYHRGVVQVEDAGFEIRDQLAWVYGSGMPKTTDVAKAIDKHLGHTSAITTTGASGTGVASVNAYGGGLNTGYKERTKTAPASPQAQKWAGYGTGLKPAWEPIVLARKPLVGTLAANTLFYGAGGLNTGACMVDSGTGVQHRWPANIMHDGSDDVTQLFPFSSSGARGDSGSAARLFYCDKPDTTERGATNNHPTLKPLSLMRYLCRLVTPSGGYVLDPFCGSGTTGVAAVAEGFSFAGIELDPEYAQLATDRLRPATGHK